MMKVNCPHWSRDPDIDHAGLCAIGKGGGSSSVGVCRACEHFGGVENAPEPPPNPPESPVRAKWAELHQRAAFCPDPPDAASERLWVADFVDRVGCGGCGDSAKAWLGEHPLMANSRVAYFQWTVDWHNDVNRKLGKPILSASEAEKALAEQMGLTMPELRARQREASPIPRITVPGEPAAEDQLILTDATGHAVTWKDRYRGSSAFLLCAGPSLRDAPLDEIRKRQFLTMAVNNAPISATGGGELFRTDLWTCVDDPHCFPDVLWRDPRIVKFVSATVNDKPLYRTDSKAWDSQRVRDCPNVIFYPRQGDHFDPSIFLTEPNICWGLIKGGPRNVMLVALRLLCHLGIKRIYLLGCDFKMETNRPYGFKLDEGVITDGVVRASHAIYRTLDKWLGQLLPVLEAHKIKLVNCTPNSNLHSVPYMPIDDALQWEGLLECNHPNHLYGEKVPQTAGV